MKKRVESTNYPYSLLARDSQGIPMNFIPEEWTFEVLPDGTRVPDKHLGPGALINKMTRQRVERDQPGSPYIKLDMRDEEVRTRLFYYEEELDSRLKEEKMTRQGAWPPESYPLPVEMEAYMLARLMDQGGYLNLWDTSVELMREDGTAPTFYGNSLDNFISGLDAEVKTLKAKPDAPHDRVSRSEHSFTRRRFIKQALIGTTAVAAAAAGSKAAIRSFELNNSDIEYIVTSEDAEEGLWGIISRELGIQEDAEIQEYYTSGTWENRTAEEEGREPDTVWEGDILILPKP